MQQVVSHTAVGVSRSGWCLTNRKYMLYNKLLMIGDRNQGNKKP
jgi:hypothetical protein